MNDNRVTPPMPSDDEDDTQLQKDQDVNNHDSHISVDANHAIDGNTTVIILHICEEVYLVAHFINIQHSPFNTT